MKLIFEYNNNSNYSTRDLKGGYDNNFSLLDVYQDGKGPSFENPAAECL